MDISAFTKPQYDSARNVDISAVAGYDSVEADSSALSHNDNNVDSSVASLPQNDEEKHKTSQNKAEVSCDDFVGCQARGEEIQKESEQENQHSKIFDEVCGLQEKSQGSLLDINDRRDFSPLPQNSQKAECFKPNFLIKGNNLLALHSLKHRKDIYGQVKLIYIDPPYNPNSAANTFSYNNNFNHSSWLTFMKNRLEIAKDFLKEDGIFCVAIDHNELFYLGVLCDEIFGRENRIGLVSVETNPGGRSDSKFLATSNEFFIAYAKNIDKASINDLKSSDDELKQYKLKDEISNYKLVPLKRTGSNSTPDKRPNLCFPIYYDKASKKISLEKQNGLVEILPMGSDNIMRVWRWGKKKIIEQINDLEVKENKGVFTINVKDRIKFSKKAKTQWSNPRYDASSYGTKYLDKFKLNDNFSYPKPIGLMEDIIELFTKEGDLILDYHAGSGTTLEAAHKMKRRWVGIEQMDYVESITKERLKKVIAGEQGGVSKALKFSGGGEFIYCELMPLNAMYKEKIMGNSSCSDFLESASTSSLQRTKSASHSSASHNPKNSSAILELQNSKEIQEKELNEIYKDLQEKAFVDYRVDIKKLLNDRDFHALSIEEKKKILYAILDSNMDYVLYEDIEDSTYAVSEDLIKLNKAFYGDLKAGEKGGQPTKNLAQNSSENSNLPSTKQNKDGENQQNEGENE